MSDEPRRWLDSEISPELKGLLRSAEGDAALPAQVAGLHAKLERALGPAFGGGAEAGVEAQAQNAASSSTAATGGGAVIGGALALASILMLGLGALWYGARTSEPPPAPVQIAAVAPPQIAPQPSVAHVGSRVAPVAPVAPVTPQPSAAAPKPAQPSARLPQKVAQGGGLLEELRQLEAIRRKLPDQPARALAAIAQHARRFPQGALGPERELLRIEALQRAGRAEDARRAAEQALAQERQPYAVQIRQLMAAGERQP